MGDEGGGPRLPVLGGLWAQLSRGDGPPTLDEARRTLGGPWVGAADVGRTVDLRGSIARRGVVVHGGPMDRDVWAGGGRIHRVEVARVTLVEDEPALAGVAADAQVHAALQVGTRVIFQARDGKTERGTLTEKMRYGSLVGTDDGRVVAVSFRRVGPVAEGEIS